MAAPQLQFGSGRCSRGATCVTEQSISVIIPTFNRASLVTRAIRSALSAVDAGDEIIVVDDGSTDDTATAVAQFGDQIRYLRVSNRGPGAARNYAIDRSTKPLISFLDSDDEWFPDKLRLQRALLAARPHLVFCFSDFLLCAQDGHEERMYLRHWHGVNREWSDILGAGAPFSSLAPLPAGRGDFLVHEGDLYPALISGPFVPAWTSLVRRAAAGDALRFAEDTRIGEDWECFARLSRVGAAAYMACETAINNSHPGARLTKSHNQLQLLDSRLRMTERVWGADTRFLETHAALYARTVSAIRYDRARWLLSRGRTAEARAELRGLGGHLGARTLSHLPPALARTLGSSRRAAIAAIHAALHLLPFIPEGIWPDL